MRKVPKSISYLIVVAAFSAFAFRLANNFMAIYATEELRHKHAVGHSHHDGDARLHGADHTREHN